MKSIMLAIGGLCALLVGATARTADLEPVFVTNLTGGLRVQQDVPCDDDVDLTTPVTGGRLELAPSQGIDTTGGGKFFMMTRATLVFAGFSVSRSCLGISRTRTYTDIKVQIVRTVSFTATPTATPGQYSFVIPKSNLVLSYITTANGETESGTKIPKEDPTGTINLTARTMTLRVVLATRVTFKAGCVELVGCVINETDDGTQTATIAGTLTLPDADGDGVPDRSDNCRLVANPDQTPVPTPTIAAPADVTVPSCQSAFGTATAADVCDAGPVTVTNNAPSVLSTGPNTITWRAQDFLGRSATDTQIVTVIDTTAPTFTAVPVDLSLNNCGPASLGTATAVDDCAGTPAITNNAPPSFQVGTTVVTWTARDAAGNAATAMQKVIVTDLTPPVLGCEATNPTGSSFRVSAIDACEGNVAIHFGTFVLKEGETIMINETGQPGVRQVNSISKEGYRHFHVGKGEAVLTATDAAGNGATLSCPVR